MLAPAASEVIARSIMPLPPPDEQEFAARFDRFADHRVVLLGEATHGTAEFYRARAAISRHFIARHGFTILAVEADWPDAAAIDHYVQHRPGRPALRQPFQRFPSWMWRNAEVAALADWMRSHNGSLPPARRAGFHGLDIYNMTGSIAAVLAYLDRVDPDAASLARERYGCLSPWKADPARYGRATLTAAYRTCEDAVVAQCRELLQRRADSEAGDTDSLFDATQNARLVASAERYYRTMYRGGAESWNLRDTHMFETLCHLLEARGPDAKALVWAHNSHIGDARHTHMGQALDEINIGQLCRERFGREAVLIGFGTHAGTVAAASDWGGSMEVKRVRPSHPRSHERICHDTGRASWLLDFAGAAEAQALLGEQRLERFIGVIYLPDTELSSHYAQASLSQQFDAYVWFEETSAVTPLGAAPGSDEPPDTYPFGL
jgi:erythromycin esterase-like protein